MTEKELEKIDALPLTERVQKRLDANLCVSKEDIQSILDGNWKSVDEHTPENSSKRYLCYMTSGAIKKGYYWKDEWRNDEYSGTFEELGYTITHYTELPKPPK